MKEKERGVSYYDLFIESRLHGEADKHPRPVLVGTALQLANLKWRPGPFSLGAAAVKVTLADWRTAPGRRDHYLVINRADASLPDIPLRHLDNGATRMAGKDRREGIDFTCHILIREHADPARPALMLMTNGSSLTADKVCNVLGALFRQARWDDAHIDHFRRAHPSGAAGKTASLNSHFAVGGHQNATLTTLLNGGRLDGVELISETQQQLDAASTLGVTSVQYTLEQVRPGRVGVASIMRAISEIRGRGTDLTKARVRYRPPGRDKPESHTFDIGALEQAFVRKETIRFEDPIAARYERVEMRVVDRLVALANREAMG